MREVTASAATREEAIQNALEQLGVEMYQVDKIEVLDEWSRGFLGFGARPVRVKIVVENLPDEPRRPAPREARQDSEPAAPRSDRGDRADRGRQRGPRGDRGRGGERERGDRDRGGRDQQRDKSRDRGGRPERPAQAPGEAAARPDRPDRPPRPAQQDNGDRERAPRQERGERPARTPRPPRPERAPRPERQEQPVTVEAEEGVPAELLDEREQAIQPEEGQGRGEEESFAPISDEQGQQAAQILHEIVGRMGIEGQVGFTRAEDGSARLNIATEDSAILIGRKGRTLSALQYLINRMLGGDVPDNSERLVVDVEGYVDRRKSSLEEMALNLAQKAKDTSRNMRLKPLSPQERRIIHLTLESDPDVRTYSVGESLYRSVIISPKNAPSERTGRPPRSRGGRGGRGRRSGRAQQQRHADFDAGPLGD